MNIKNVFKQSALLTVSKILTMLVGIIQAMLLAHKLSTGDYALYSKTTTCVNIAASISVMGLNDAVLYFFNKSSDVNERDKYINSIFFLQIIFGITTGLVLFAGIVPISNWMKGPLLQKTIPIVFLQPLLINLSSDYTTLFLSEDLAKEIAVVSVVLAPVRLIATIIAVFSNTPVLVYFGLILIFDLIQVVFLCAILQKKRRTRVNPLKYEKNYFSEILKFSIPLGVAILVKSILVECDKLIISNQCFEAEYATYAAVSRTLPITLFAASMASVLLPQITKHYHSNEKEQLYDSLRFYYLSGAVTSVLLGFAILPISKEVISVLYSDKYLSGISIFIIYIFNDIIGFAYAGMLLTVTGNPKTLLLVNSCSLVANIILDYILIKAIGIIGPALVTVSVSVFNFVFQSSLGCKKAGISFVKAFPTKEIVVSAVKCGIISIGLYMIKSMLFSFTTLVNIIVYGAMGVFLSALLCKGTLFKILGVGQKA